MSKFSKIKNLEQLDREIRLLKRQSKNASKNFHKEVNNALWYYSPTRMITDMFDSIKKLFRWR